MDGVDVSADHVIAELVEMGFEFSQAVEAAKSVGPCLQDAVDFILNVSWGKSTAENKTDYKPVDRSLSSKGCSSSQASLLGKRSSCSYPEKRVKQSTITKHLQSLDGKKKCNRVGASGAVFLLSNESEASLQDSTHRVEPVVEPFQGVPGEHCLPLCGASGEFGSDWEQKAQNILQKHFGFSSLKGFQKEAIEAWLANRDCLVLAATGSGKSLCFQIPALLSGKVVVVISPLISLMHDQCLKLAKHGVSACFLGSGQTDSTVERKAMRGLYGIVYVCPETVLRLIGPLQKLAENRGIALFAIDEVHCISKWGHDFRPDYRKLSILRENFKAFKLKMLKFDIPLMALTATATTDVREDILKSLHMSKETKVVLTSFFRPNLRFSVRHSRTSCISSYCKDFKELIDAYRTKRMTSKGKSHTLIYGTEDQFNGSNISDELHLNDCEISSDSCNENSSETSLTDGNSEMTVEFLEDEVDVCKDGDDLDVFSAEFHANCPYEDSDLSGSSERPAPPVQCEQLLEVPQGSEGQGPTIIYVPTRKETLTLAKYLCSIGVKAAAYHAKLPKTHLRQVHKEFHQNVLQVVVATIAFGMGIDKSNVRRIIHYGWPQSLEAYYQEAGRAGRDGKLADCTLYADLSKIPSLLPSQRSKEQTRHAYKLLRDCFRYGMATTCCRAKTLVSYFGELASEKCLLCDVCVSGPPGLQNMKAEADAFMRVLASYSGSNVCEGSSYERPHSSNDRRGRHMGKANLRMVISQIREQYQGFASTDRLWWQGLARLLEEKGYLREGDDMIKVSMKYPEVTELGLKFISETEKNFYAYPEADMLLSKQTQKPFSSFSEWGRGWADPQIRRQRLEGRKGRRKIRKKKYSRKHDKDLKTVRGRITAKLSK